MKDRIRKKSLGAFVLIGACTGGGDEAMAFAPPRREHRFREMHRHRTGHDRRRQQLVTLSVAGTKRPRTVDLVASDSTDTLHTDKPAKPKVTFGLLPDFMQKDPLAVTKQKWLEKTMTPENIEEKTASDKRRDTEMMAMSAFSVALAIGVVYALASAAPDMMEPKEINQSENVVRDLMRGGNVERLEFATRNIVDTVLPQSAEDVIAVSIGEGIAGAIGAFATWLLGMLLNFKNNEDFIVTTMDSEGMEEQSNMDALYTEAVADGDYFLTRAAAEPLFEALGIPVFFASLASVLIATVPYEAVKISSQKRRNELQEKALLDILLEEEEMRKRDKTVVDTLSNKAIDFFQRLNVRANTDDFEDDFDDEDFESDSSQQDAPTLDYVELFADITKWLEYDVLISNYRGILALPSGELISTGWESAIFGLLAALSSQLYTDVLYLYSDFGIPAKREKTINRSLEGWASVYATKCLSTATLFGVYEAVRGPTSRVLSQFISGGVGGCTGSANFDLCVETYLVDNPPAASVAADFRAFFVSTADWADNLSWLLPLNDQESLASFARGSAVSLYSVLERVFNM